MLKSITKLCNENRMTLLGTKAIVEMLFAYVVGRVVIAKAMSKEEFRAGLLEKIDALWEGWTASVARGEGFAIKMDGESCKLCGRPS